MILLHCLDGVLEDQASLKAADLQRIYIDLTRVINNLTNYVVQLLCTFPVSLEKLRVVGVGKEDTSGLSIMPESLGPPALHELLIALKIVYMTPEERKGEINIFDRKEFSTFKSRWDEFLNRNLELCLSFSVISSILSALQEYTTSVDDINSARVELLRIGLISACVCCIPHRIEISRKGASKNEDLFLNDVKRDNTREALRCLSNAVYNCTCAQVCVFMFLNDILSLFLSFMAE